MLTLSRIHSVRHVPRVGFLALVALAVGLTCCAHATPVIEAGEPTRAVLGAGDVVEVRVYNEPDLSAVYRITDDGTVRMPLVGDIAVSGLSVEEATDRIEAAYNAKYLQHAEAAVFVREANSRKVFVLGEIARPGPYPYEERMTMIGALARAGGTTKFADANRTVLTRVRNGKQDRITVEAGNIGRGLSPDIDLLPGDIVFVPEALF
jgi:polysaccharide export outer membrane protein